MDRSNGDRTERKREREKEREREKVERIEEEVKAGGGRRCRHDGLFDPLSLFPPDLSRGRVCRARFLQPGNSRRWPLATCRDSRRASKNGKPEVESRPSGSNKWARARIPIIG